MRLKRLILFAFFLTAVFAFLHRAEAVVMAMDDDCDISCGPTVACDEGCWVDLFHTTCGEYDGGHTNDWCDGDTCDDICSPFTGGEFACWLDGDLVDCETYGDYAECGDGYCAVVDGDEDCDNCEQDCGICVVDFPECGDIVCDSGESYWRCAECDDESIECGDGECGGDEPDTCPRDCTYSQDLCDNEDNECPNGWECDEFGFCVAETAPLWVVCKTQSGQCPQPGHVNLLCDTPSLSDCVGTEVCDDLPLTPWRRYIYQIPNDVLAVCRPGWTPVDPFGG